MPVVPRLLEKVFDKIVAKGNELTGVKKAMFFWALSLGDNYKAYNENSAWYYFKLKVARKLIFSKWKEALGGNLKFMVSGSAPLQERLINIFTAAGMPIYEGYGMTETSPGVSINDLRNRGFKVGTVGKTLKGIEVKIANDGEILVKGSNIMLGYYKNEKLTKETAYETSGIRTVYWLPDFNKILKMIIQQCCSSYSSVSMHCVMPSTLMLGSSLPITHAKFKRSSWKKIRFRRSPVPAVCEAITPPG